MIQMDILNFALSPVGMPCLVPGPQLAKIPELKQKGLREDFSIFNLIFGWVGYNGFMLAKIFRGNGVHGKNKVRGQYLFVG